MANHIVNGSTDGCWKGRVARRLIVQWRRDGLLDIAHVFMADAIQLSRTDAGFDVWGNVVKNFTG